MIPKRLTYQMSHEVSFKQNLGVRLRFDGLEVEQQSVEPNMFFIRPPPELLLVLGPLER